MGFGAAVAVCLLGLSPEEQNLDGHDIPMAQFIINMDAAMPASQKFIIRVLDSTHLFVQPYVAEMIRSRISEFRDQNSYEKPA
ncbi:TFIIH complex subunit tfb5 [Asimina triloba]